MIASLVVILAAVAGGGLFHWLDFPVPFLLGSLFGAIIARNLVGPILDTSLFRRGGIVLISAAAAGMLTQDAAAALFGMLPLVLGASAVLLAISAALSGPVARMAQLDRLTALLACLPAGMGEMANLARELGARAEAVAAIHSLRIVILLGLLPIWTGLTLGDAIAAASAPETESALGLIVFVAAGAGGAVVAARAGLQNPWVTLPLLLGLILVSFGGTVPAMPQPVLNAAQIALGGSIGARFTARDIASLPRAAIAGVFSSLILIAVSFLVLSAIVSELGGIDRASATLAVAPGGSGEMIAAAQSLGLATAIVAGFHFVRSLVTNMVVPPIIRALVRRGLL